MQRLYGKGARKFAVVRLPPVGCLPVEVTTHSISNILYVEQENIDSQGYNTKLEDLVSRLNSQHSGIHIEYVDIYNPMAELLEDPKRFDKIIV
ncbi:hypothetical protein CDL15_Pgr013621 [Punica granatum]|uniref:Uncharacterized protein n=1 Tax=Punica granatum TaxID=22663 RepID=A0A218W0P8_PUNGR|nr:hypothetical protein CDL15_Pgr013621 [Punica granatum]